MEIRIAGNRPGSTGPKKVASPFGGDDELPGSIWHYKVSHDGRVETGQFRVHQLQIFHGKEKIGAVKVKDEDESSFRIAGWPELNGEAIFQKVKGQPGVAKGTLIRPNGQKWDLELQIKER